MQKNILVTGGAGYIGSHTCKALSLAGYTPVTYDNLSNGHESLVKWGPFEKGDILDKERLGKVIEQYKPEAIVHFAAFIAAGESVDKPGKYYKNNTYGSLNLIETAIDYDIKKLVFSSTAAVYGIPETMPITEDTDTSPINPYGSSKLFVEQILSDFAVSDDLKYIALRYFNAAGADPENQTGCMQPKPTNLIPVLMDVQSGVIDSMKIFGTNYDTDDGTCIRDYIHVSDLADAHILALNYLFENGESQVLNLGTGQGYSVRQVIESVEKISGKLVKYEETARRAGDPPALTANPQKALDILGWSAKYTNIDDITSSAWNWCKKEI